MKTNAVRLLEGLGVPIRIREYPVDEAHMDAVSVAGLLGVEPERVFKTLVTVAADGTHRVFCIPGPLELDLAGAAAAAGVKSVRMLPLKQLQPLTGYVHGGCSPFGMKSAFPVIIDETVELFETVFVSGGRRGLQIEIASEVLIELLDAKLADVTRAA
ncbi:MAG: Cys-tRNA(Pro) deacylase [Alkalispirochaeta sp.]